MVGDRQRLRHRAGPAVRLGAGALFVSVSSVLIDLAGTTPGTASFYRCALSLPFLAVAAESERRRRRTPDRPEILLGLLAGAFFAGDMLLWTRAIDEVGAGLSTVVVNVQVIGVPLLAWLIDGERAPLRATNSPRLPSHVGAALLMLTPVGALVLSALVLHERPTWLQLIGAVLILAGAYFSGNRLRVRRTGRARDRRGPAPRSP